MAFGLAPGSWPGWSLFEAQLANSQQRLFVVLSVSTSYFTLHQYVDNTIKQKDLRVGRLGHENESLCKPAIFCVVSLQYKCVYGLVQQ